MNKLILIFTVILCALSNPSLSYDFNEKEFCDELRANRQNLNDSAGKEVDKYTMNEGVITSCSKKLVKFRKIFLAEGKKLTQEWKNIKSKQWNDM
jgi:hypothetical protein